MPLRSAAAAPADAKSTAAVIAAAAYELFPHEEVGEAHYAALAAAFIDADIDRADNLAAALGAAAFLAASRAERIAQMEAQQGRADFQALRMHVLLGLYTDLSVTRHFGYEGPSFAQGGYLERGFDDARWVPVPNLDGD